MGTYTEMYLGVELKKDTPDDVLHTLRTMLEGKGEPPHVAHPLFKTERWPWMLRSDSYYFDAAPVYSFEYDDSCGSWFLTFVANVKNYCDEWKEFIDWLGPWIYSTGHIGHRRHEACDLPTILFRNYKGTIKEIEVPVPVDISV